MAPPPPLSSRTKKVKEEVKKVGKQGMRRGSAVERSAYFARREAARVLRAVLHGDARRRAAASIKSLVYSPSVRNKKATFALVCQTLKYLPLIKDVLGSIDILNSKCKRQEELVYVTAYDILFGQDAAMTGDVEKFLMLHKDALQLALAKMYVRKEVKCAEDLLQNNPASQKPRYVRVNTLKMDVKSAIQEFDKSYTVAEDDVVPDLLVFPPGTDLHNHSLVMNGSVFLQGKASSMVPVALNPKPGWKVLDACAAPGNKTVHLAALMKGKGNIIACELHKERVKLLEDTIRRSGASNVDVIHCDFLEVDNRNPVFSEVRAILLDPSCSGSGISAERLDHLLPSHTEGHDSDAIDGQRTRKLAAFQRKALVHALSFPAVERVVYSTCSINQTENEEVIKSVLPLATSLNFELATPLPQWPRRGLPVFDGFEKLLRTDPTEDLEGFFVALFVRKRSENVSTRPKRRSLVPSKRGPIPWPFNKVSLLWLKHSSTRCRVSKKENKACKRLGC